MAIDGWTNLRHKKCMNIVILIHGCAIFWRTIPLKFGKFAAIVAALLQKAILEMEGLASVVSFALFAFTEMIQVKVVSVVADNENANRGLFKLLVEWRPHLICLGDTKNWDGERLKEANEFIKQKLQAQLNLYSRGEHPFFSMEMVANRALIQIFSFKIGIEARP